MKKTLVLIVVMALVFQSMSFTFANKFLEVDVVELTDSYDHETKGYKVVNMMIDGNDVYSDVPSILYVKDGNTRTLVPISFIAKQIGATISWDGNKKQVTIVYEGKTIVLTIDSNIALVNGVEMKLPNDVPAKLMDYEGTYRTMVPVNFVSQHLGYEIFWDGNTRTVSLNKPEQTLTGVRYVNTGTYPEVRFKVTGEVSATSFSVDGASVGGENTLVVELHNTNLNLTEPPRFGRYIINDLMNEVIDIKVEQVEGNPNGVKATVGLGYYRNGDVSYDASTGEVVVQMINAVKYVDVEKVNQATAVVIESLETPAYNVSKLSDRVIIDIIHSKFLEEDSAFEVHEGGIASVSYTQVDNSDYYDVGTRFARITVKLENGMTSDNVYVDNADSKVYVFVQDSILSTYSYARNIDTGTSNFALNLLTPDTYKVNYEASTRTISFSVPVTNVSLIEGTDQRDDGVVDKISVVKSGENYNIQLVLAENTSYTTSKAVNSSFNISMVNEILKNSDYKDKLIVIDAGHGGHDPGAVSGGHLEKDIALEAALVLKRKMENAGFKVYLTRERDTYVKLYDRAGIANQLDADLFISIHINAAGNTTANGVEVLYDPDATRSNYTLAKAIQSELVKATGAYNRGVVSRPDLVVTRETEMDAVLVELGFITNFEEQQKLLTPSYIEKCAEAILEGVIDFME
ncbi:MAG: N-acetylmuramoyl-L-alanine amidase [Clostridia bacterium]|nr:N-acetylmuramoyl-L-alanine amidase [Clostridia bacterium]